MCHHKLKCTTPDRKEEDGPQTTNLPVSLDFVKQQASIDPSDTTFDAQLTEYIRSAENVVEGWIGKTLLTHSYIASWHLGFPECLEIQDGPLFLVTKIEYIPDGQDNYVTLEPIEYSVFKEKHFQRVFADNGWPTSAAVPDAVQLYYTAGFGVDDTSVPSEIKLALSMIATKAFNERGDCCTGSPLNLLEPAIKLLRDYKPCRGVYIN